jgi:hypothetical protein
MASQARDRMTHELFCLYVGDYTDHLRNWFGRARTRTCCPVSNWIGQQDHLQSLDDQYGSGHLGL